MINLHYLIFTILIISTTITDNSDNIESWEKRIEYTVNSLEKSPCTSGIKLGDFVVIGLSTFSIPNTSKSYVNTAFKVGEFGVPYINKAIIDMCIGDIKRIGIPIGQGKIFYQFEILSIKNV